MRRVFQFPLAVGLAAIVMAGNTPACALQLAGKVPGVISGFEIGVTSNSLSIAPGLATIDGRQVAMETTATLEFDPAVTEHITAEPVVLPAELSAVWMPGGHLEKSRTTNMIPGPLAGDSLVVKLPDNTQLNRDTDYVVNNQWAKLAWKAGGRLTTNTKVLVDYDISKLRIDGIDLSTDGKLVVKKGQSHLVCPLPPERTSGSLRLAQVFRPYHAQAIEEWQVFACGTGFAEPTPDQMKQASLKVSSTLAKLRKGEPVAIVTWGDSVTVGGDTSRPELAYANLFITRLKERFPKATITHINAGIGGSNTNDRLPGLDKNVLSHKPDLVTIEFVNDAHLPMDQVEKNWNEALTRIKAADAETIVITPHFTMPEFMGNKYPRGPEIRPLIPLLRKVAEKYGAGVADTSKRWAHLDAEGIPYITLLYNGINHPDDRGHEMFVRDLMAFFPAE